MVHYINYEVYLFNKCKGFEEKDVKETLDGMRRHQNHNGVQLEGIKRLAALCEEGEIPNSNLQLSISITMSNLLVNRIELSKSN
jgi:hypothetical protein